jgi:hypothetical protein
MKNIHTNTITKRSYITMCTGTMNYTMSMSIPNRFEAHMPMYIPMPVYPIPTPTGRILITDMCIKQKSLRRNSSCKSIVHDIEFDFYYS